MFQNLSGNKDKNSGFVFLEVLIATTLISIVLVFLLGMGGQLFAVYSSIVKSVQINSLIKEEIEAVRSFRDGTVWQTNGLGILSTGDNNPYFASLDNSVNPSAWKLSLGTETIDGFTRKIIFDKVSRNPATKNIEAVYNAANDDPDTRRIIASVYFNGRTYQTVTYFTNWKP